MFPIRAIPPVSVKIALVWQKGFGTNLSYNFTKYLVSRRQLRRELGAGVTMINAITFGPKATWRGEGVNFFMHTLLGYKHLSATEVRYSNGIAAVLGGGMDLKIWKPIWLRVFEADYQWARQNFAAVVPPDNPGLRRPSYDGARLTTGLVFNFGGAPEVPVAAACSVQTTTKSWSANRCMPPFPPATSTPSTRSLTPGLAAGARSKARTRPPPSTPTARSGGSYTATATVTDPKAKKNNTASCTANFTVKEPPKNPPQMSCSASPSTVQTGDTGHHHLHLHQSGQRSGHGGWMDLERRQHFRQRKLRHPEHDRRLARSDHDQRYLYRLARLDGLDFELGDG